MAVSRDLPERRLRWSMRASSAQASASPQRHSTSSQTMAALSHQQSRLRLQGPVISRASRLRCLSGVMAISSWFGLKGRLDRTRPWSAVILSKGSSVYRPNVPKSEVPDILGLRSPALAQALVSFRCRLIGSRVGTRKGSFHDHHGPPPGRRQRQRCFHVVRAPLRSERERLNLSITASSVTVRAERSLAVALVATLADRRFRKCSAPSSSRVHGATLMRGASPPACAAPSRSLRLRRRRRRARPGARTRQRAPRSWRRTLFRQDRAECLNIQPS